jgi:hypothetical protein
MRKATAQLLAAATALLLLPAVASASTFHPADRYDCFAPQALTGGTLYVNSYQFESRHRYAVGVRSTRLTGLSRQVGHGTYKVSGNRIVSLSGSLGRHKPAFLIQRNDLALLKPNGQFAAIGCYDFTRHALPSPTTPTGPGAFPIGTYTCYHNSLINGSYYQSFGSSLTFYDDGTYFNEGSIREDGWRQQGTSVVFTAGPLWSTYAHDVGTWYPKGVPMPNAQGAVAGALFTLVIRDTVAEGGIPPSVEYSTTDGLNGGSTQPQSFRYCKL